MEKIETIEQENNQGNNTEKASAFWKKAGEFFDKNYALFFAPIVVALIYICALWRYDVYPFGSKYTVASYDLSAQICPFIEHLFDVINGKSSLTYSYGIAGGADVTGTFLYFFISPFSFLFLIFGEGMVAHASSIVMLCKLITITFAGTWFAKKLFKGIPDYLCIIIGIVYAYCGYTFVANTYINWMDFLIYLPFCVAAFRRFVKTGKFLVFSIMMACCVYTCFSIACFSMLIVFPALIAYSLLCVKKEDRNKFISHLVLSFVVTILISLPILLPALMATMNSARTGGLFDNLWFGYTNDVFDKEKFIEKLTTSWEKKWSYILTDAVFILLTVLWFFRKGLKDKFAQFMLVAGILTLLPVVVDECMLLLNMGSYYSYSLRFGFLNAVYFLGGACLCLEGICFKHYHAYDGTPLCPVQQEEKQKEGGRYETKAKKPVSYCVLSIVAIVVGLLAALILIGVFVGMDKFVLMSSSEYNNAVNDIVARWPSFMEDFIRDICSALRSSAGAFAHSLGDIFRVSFIFVVVVFFGAIGAFLVSIKKVSPKLFSYLLIVVVSAQVLFFNGQLVIGNRSTQYEKLSWYTDATEQLYEMDDSYYRIKDFGDNRKQSDGSWKLNETIMGNAPLVAGSNCFSVFSSVIEDYNFVTYPLFWYNGNSTNSLKSLGRSKSFSDAFLGYKYYWVPYKKDDIEAADGLDYLEKVMVEGEDGKQTQLIVGKKTDTTDDRYALYENTIVFPSAYVLPRGDFRFPNENDKVNDNRKANMAALYEFLGGDPYDPAKGFPNASMTKKVSEKLHATGVEIEVGAGKITAKATAKEGECLFLNFVASRGYSVTVNGKKAELIDNDLKFLSVALEEGKNVVEFTYSSPYVKYSLVGLVGAVFSLVVVALILKNTKLMEKSAKVISWAGIIVASCVVAFFMVYPTAVFGVKLVELLKCVL